MEDTLTLTPEEMMQRLSEPAVYGALARRARKHLPPIRERDEDGKRVIREKPDVIQIAGPKSHPASQRKRSYRVYPPDHLISDTIVHCADNADMYKEQPGSTLTSWALTAMDGLFLSKLGSYEYTMTEEDDVSDESGALGGEGPGSGKVTEKSGKVEVRSTHVSENEKVNPPHSLGAVFSAAQRKNWKVWIGWKGETHKGTPKRPTLEQLRDKMGIYSDDSEQKQWLARWIVEECMQPFPDDGKLMIKRIEDHKWTMDQHALALIIDAATKRQTELQNLLLHGSSEIGPKYSELKEEFAQLAPVIDVLKCLGVTRPKILVDAFSRYNELQELLADEAVKEDNKSVSLTNELDGLKEGLARAEKFGIKGPDAGGHEIIPLGTKSDTEIYGIKEELQLCVRDFSLITDELKTKLFALAKKFKFKGVNPNTLRSRLIKLRDDFADCVETKEAVKKELSAATGQVR